MVTFSALTLRSSLSSRHRRYWVDTSEITSWFDRTTWAWLFRASCLNVPSPLKINKREATDNRHVSGNIASDKIPDSIYRCSIIGIEWITICSIKIPGCDEIRSHLEQSGLIFHLCLLQLVSLLRVQVTFLSRPIFTASSKVKFAGVLSCACKDQYKIFAITENNTILL